MKPGTREVLANALAQLQEREAEAQKPQRYYLRVHGDPVLSEPTTFVRSLDEVDPELLPSMQRIMDNARGVGLAAPQVGSSLRIAIARLEAIGKRETVVMFNPTIIAWSDEIDLRTEEGCLSCPSDATGLHFFRTSTRRHRWVKVAYDEFEPPPGGCRRHQMRLEGHDAQVLQHESDHLEGRCIFDNLSRPLRRAAERGIAAYLKARGRTR